MLRKDTIGKARAGGAILGKDIGEAIIGALLPDETMAIC